MDYSIYIHSVGEGYVSPTVPKQLGGTEDLSGVGGEGSSGSGFGVARRAASFIQNPDSAIGAVGRFFSSKLGEAAVSVFAIATVTKITDKSLTLYNQSLAFGGDIAPTYNYNNFKQQLHNVTHPFSTQVAKQQAILQIRKANAIAEQEQLLTGGTILNSKYGRHL